MPLPRSRHWAPALALLTALLAPGAPEAVRPGAEITCADIPDFTELFFSKHLRVQQLSEEIRNQTARKFLQNLDPQRLLFLEHEAKFLEQELGVLFQETSAGDCSRLLALREEVVARNLEIERFVKDYAGAADYALDESVELIADPDERGHPQDRAAREALLRVLVHFQIADYLEDELSLDQAQERLLHRYQLRTRRAREITEQDLYSAFLDTFARTLDPHSSYFSPDFFEDFQIQMQLSLEGIGVALGEEDGYSIVRRIIPGGATDRSKALQPDDRIVSVAEADGEAVDVVDMALRDVVRLIRGKKGTLVRLGVQRGAERLQVAIVRDKVDLEQQAAKMRIEEMQVEGHSLRLAALDFPLFYGGTGRPGERLGSRDLLRLLQEARGEQVDGLLLDLSSNSGGVLEDAVRITGFFLCRGNVVAVQNTMSPRSLEVYTDPSPCKKRHGPGILYKGPMVVLTSRISASASEILAGAMQDYGRAVVVGDGHTFGKGSVQTVFPFQQKTAGRDLGAIKLTTGLYFRPSGASTQLRGVESDIVLPSLFASDRFGERASENALPAQSIPPFTGKGAGGYQPIGGELLAELARRSAARVADDPDFEEIREKIAEREADDGILRLGEIIAERREKRAAEEAEKAEEAETAETELAQESEGAEDDDEDPTPQQQEALRILADLVLLSR